jgi:hypothetical protein
MIVLKIHFTGDERPRLRVIDAREIAHPVSHAANDIGLGRSNGADVAAFLSQHDR